MLPILFAILSVILVVFVHGFVASVVWGWFLVPLGVPSISAWHAVGICGLMYLLVPNRTTEDEKKKKKKAAEVPESAKDAFGKLIDAVVDAVAEPLVILILCWLVK